MIIKGSVRKELDQGATTERRGGGGSNILFVHYAKGVNSNTSRSDETGLLLSSLLQAREAAVSAVHTKKSGKVRMAINRCCLYLCTCM
jgi:hypothetical protein